jgi:nitrogen fixation NifU-like protein
MQDLYQEVILDHNRSPRNFRRIEAPTHQAEGYNPLCGDRVSLTAVVDGDRITDLAFEGAGCAISKASASLMTDRLKGCTVDEARDLFERFQRMVTGALDQEAEDLGKLTALAGVREFPVRVKCASLAWHTLKAALEKHERVSTE